MQRINLSNWKILIADDEPDNLSLLQDILTFFDASVTSATSGQIAIDFIDHQPFTLALLDVQMPKVTGWDVIRHIRESSRTEIKGMLVIAVTALAMKGDRERILDAGFDGYISKPIDTSNFIQTIQQIVQSRNVVP